MNSDSLFGKITWGMHPLEGDMDILVKKGENTIQMGIPPTDGESITESTVESQSKQEKPMSEYWDSVLSGLLNEIRAGKCRLQQFADTPKFWDMMQSFDSIEKKIVSLINK